MVNLLFRFLILRNREYNGDLSFAHLDILGRSYDETQALTLGLFSRYLCRVAQMRSNLLYRCGVIKSSFFILRLSV